ncbi:MAG: ABC transporter permease subunit [Chloroflexota bacterium]|nr:ABC transporter permease subunit [Chloroflexota bacterium]
MNVFIKFIHNLKDLGSGWILNVSALILVLICFLSWRYVLTGESGFAKLFNQQTWINGKDFVSLLMGTGLGSDSAFLSKSSWGLAIRLSVNTFLMSILAILIASLAVVLTFVPASRSVAIDASEGQRNWPALLMFALIRSVFLFSRSVPELVWAMLILFVFSPGIIVAAVALAIHNYGVLGRLSSEIVENMDQRPIRSIRSAGAGWGQVLIYGIIPQAMPQFVTYVLYRWEVVIRTTVVVGFVAAGGLGMHFRLNMSYQHFDDVGMLICCYLILVLFVDILAATFRRLLR